MAMVFHNPKKTWLCLATSANPLGVSPRTSKDPSSRCIAAAVRCISSTRVPQEATEAAEGEASCMAWRGGWQKGEKMETGSRKMVEIYGNMVNIRDVGWKWLEIWRFFQGFNTEMV